MTNENGSQQPAKQATTEEAPAARGGAALYEEGIRHLRAGLDQDMERALKRYGFIYVHSLAPEEHFLQREAMGIKCHDAAGHYNLALAHASRDDFEKAIALWKKALKDDPELACAEFNIAVAYERSGNLSVARKHYETYLEAAGDAEDIESVQAHLAEI